LSFQVILEARDKDREGGGAVPRRLAMLTARRGQVRMERKRWELGRISLCDFGVGGKLSSGVILPGVSSFFGVSMPTDNSEVV